MVKQLQSFFGIPNWLMHWAFYGSNDRSLAYLRLLCGYFDITPFLRKKKGSVTKKRRSMNLPPIGHIHIPKTGGTYTSSLQETLPHVNFSHVVVRTDRSDRFCPVVLRPLHPKHVKSYFLFSNVRNPVPFLVSYYYHAKGFGRYVNPRHYDYESAQKGFEYLIQTVINRTGKWPSRRFLFPLLFDQEGDCIVDWINRTERLDADLEKLASHFGVCFSPGARRRVSPREKSVQDFYSEGLLEKVTVAYEREMKLFGYEGFTVVTPILKTMPLEKERLKYDYVNDRLSIDGRILRRRG